MDFMDYYNLGSEMLKKYPHAPLFKDIPEEEEGEWRQWAWDNYEPFEPINGTWHPIVQLECTKINALYINFEKGAEDGEEVISSDSMTPEEEPKLEDIID
jgi:hypothetical protein